MGCERLFHSKVDFHMRISRHHHRISFTSFIPPGKWPCGVCRQQVDNNYGAYSCSRCDAYFVHSKCALHKKVWDGKELDGVSEEEDIIDDGEPFERIADGIILHFSHSHNMRLEISKVYDENKFCQGCALPVYDGKYYSCRECDYILHESCAYASRMKRHPVYPHPLTLNVATKEYHFSKGLFRFSVCMRDGSGFFYEHQIGNITFQLDLRCALVTKPFEHQSHKHSLFLALDPNKIARCHMCRYESNRSKFNCIECDYIICFGCATLPYKISYKHDSQFFYKCNDCCTALHLRCLLGRDIYMKPGKFLKYSFGRRRYEWIEYLYQILRNNSLSRAVCNRVVIFLAFCFLVSF